MSTSGRTFEEMSEAVTGFDELAVTKHMGMDLYGDAEARPVWLVRALVFVHKRHQGVPDVEAKEQVLSMPLGEVNDYFETDDEPNPDDPATPAGKDDSPDGSTTTS